VVAGGTIPKADADKLKKAGVAVVFTSKDHELTKMLAGDVDARDDAACNQSLLGCRAVNPRGEQPVGERYSWGWPPVGHPQLS
jgi:hypothetical protein